MNAADLPAGDPAAGRILVIDMGGTHVKFGFVVAGRPKAFAHLVPTQRLRNAHPVASLAAQTREAIALAGIEPDVIVCTVPGFIDEDEDTLLHLRNIPELDGHRLATELGRLLQRPVVLERDATLALLGESAAGCAQDCDLVMGMFFGTGIGAAMVVGGRPFRGCGWALEAGHVPCLLERNGEPDARQPTIEDCASGRALEHIATRHAEPVANVFGAATGKPELAAELERFVQYQALAVDTAVGRRARRRGAEHRALSESAARAPHRNQRALRENRRAGEPALGAARLDEYPARRAAGHPRTRPPPGQLAGGG